MMLEWNDYQKQLLARIGEVGKLSPYTMRGYQALSTAGTKTGTLDAQTRELIAAKQGATREEIAEALGVTIAVNAGAALVYSTRVMDAFSARQA